VTVSLERLRVVPPWTTRAAPLGVAALAAAVVGYVAAVDPNETGHYPTCPFLAVTGLYCPGCGALRATHALAHGDLGTAVGRNLLAVAAVLPLVVVWLQWLRRSWTGRRRTTAAPAVLIWVLLGVVLAFGVLRNVPAFSWLAP
jgi:hypothetical protein